MKPLTAKLVTRPIVTLEIGTKIQFESICGKVVYRNNLYTVIEHDNLRISYIRNDQDVRVLEERC